MPLENREPVILNNLRNCFPVILCPTIEPFYENEDGDDEERMTENSAFCYVSGCCPLFNLIDSFYDSAIFPIFFATGELDADEVTISIPSINFTGNFPVIGGSFEENIDLSAFDLSGVTEFDVIYSSGICTFLTETIELPFDTGDLIRAFRYNMSTDLFDDVLGSNDKIIALANSQNFIERDNANVSGLGINNTSTLNTTDVFVLKPASLFRLNSSAVSSVITASLERTVVFDFFVYNNSASVLTLFANSSNSNALSWQTNATTSSPGFVYDGSLLPGVFDIDDSKTHSIAITMKPSGASTNSAQEYSLYLDGVFISGGVLSSNSTGLTESIYNFAVSSVNPYLGSIDIWSRVLTQTEIETQVYNNGVRQELV